MIKHFITTKGDPVAYYNEDGIIYLLSNLKRFRGLKTIRRIPRYKYSFVTTSSTFKEFEDFLNRKYHIKLLPVTVRAKQL